MGSIASRVGSPRARLAFVAALQFRVVLCGVATAVPAAVVALVLAGVIVVGATA